jgi:excisionase family DNA binding protein
MTSIDHFAIATETLGKQCIKLSRPPHDVRFGNPHGLVSVDCTTGRWRTTAQIRVGGKTVEMSGGYLKELGEIKKKNGGGDCRTILEEAARQAIAEAEAQQAADEECEAALAANRSDLPGSSQLQHKLRQTPPDGLKPAVQAAAKLGCSIKTRRAHVAAPTPERGTAKQAATILGVPTRTIQDLAARGEIPGAAKLGRRWTFDLEKLRRLVRQKERETWQHANRQPDVSGGAKLFGAGSRFAGENLDGRFTQVTRRLRGRATKPAKTD